MYPSAKTHEKHQTIAYISNRRATTSYYMGLKAMNMC